MYPYANDDDQQYPTDDSPPHPELRELVDPDHFASDALGEP